MRILVVEDEARMADLIARGLRDRAFAVDVVADGEAALDTLGLAPYDAVVLDVMLPRLDGFEVCRRLREAGHSLPVLMVTARDDVADRIHGLDLGADDYLVKPFDFGELLARLRALLRRRSAFQTTVIEIEDLRIDTARQEATRGGRTIPLTAKEYALLEFLARNAGRVVGREEVSEHVWDENYDPFSNLIEVYINRLRKKIDQGASVPLIHTRRGAGYVFGRHSDTVEEG